MQLLAGIKTNLNESIGGYVDMRPLTEMGEENQVEAKGKNNKAKEKPKADTSWESLPREHAGAYQIKIDWNGDKQSLLDSIETVKSELEQDKTKFKYGVKLSGKYTKKGNPNYPDGGKATIYGDAAEVIAFLASDDGAGIGSEDAAKEQFMDSGMLRADRFREGIEDTEDIEKESITKSSGWQYSDDEFDQGGGESMYNDDSENPFPSMQDETGDPIQMAIQNLRSMFPGITDADIAEYLDTYQEYQSMGDGGEMNEKREMKPDQLKAIWASKNEKNEAKKGSDKPKDAPRQTGGKGVVGKVSHNVKSFNTAPGEVAKDMEKDARKDAKKTALTGNKAMAYQPPHSRVYKENKIKPSSSEFTWDI
jgi:hypothetical protein